MTLSGVARRGAALVLCGAALALMAACGGTINPRAASPTTQVRAPRQADLERVAVVPSPAVAGARCATPVQVTGYAQDDWIGLARTLATAPPGCLQAWIGVPTIEGADHAWITPAPHMKETFARLGPAVRPMPTVDFDDWSAWGTAHPGVSWLERGAIARRLMESAGYDFAAGDRWALNEVPIAAVTSQETRNALRDLLRGLQGAAGAPTGVAYAVIPIQAEGSVEAQAAALRPLLQDRAFWAAADRALITWSDEAYADVRNTCEPATSYLRQANALASYAFARQTIARDAASGASPEARAVLERSVPLANAAWRWSEAYGWTDVPADVMATFVRVQVQAMARPLAGGVSLAGGFAWAPKDARGTQLATVAAALRDQLVAINSVEMSVTPPPCSWPGARLGG